jgi:hypothetical protein
MFSIISITIETGKPKIAANLLQAAKIILGSEIPFTIIWLFTDFTVSIAKVAAVVVVMVFRLIMDQISTFW